MDALPDYRPWYPRPFSVAVLDSDPYLADVLCGLLQNSGFAAAAFDSGVSLVQAHHTTPFDAYVLDYLADWPTESDLLENLVDSISHSVNGKAPIFILGNQTAPERTEKLANIVMHYKVRYLVRPIQSSYIAKAVSEAIAKTAGL